MVERALNQSLTLSHGSLAIFFSRPIAAVLTVTVLVLLAVPIVRAILKWRSGAIPARMEA